MDTTEDQVNAGRSWREMNEIRDLFPADFPERLREIPEPPQKLRIRGAPLSPSAKFLCVVGARKNTSYGKEACERLIEGLAGYDIVIVSGLALGIDGITHRAALQAKLSTLAIPGSGLGTNILYPRNHVGLAEEIIASGGTLLSEFADDFQAHPFSFPQRNRIMAGLSHAVLVVEAEQKSGTLITSRLATEYNRDIFTVPGSIFSKNSEGPHLLLRLGATPITSSNDLLQALGFDTPPQTKTIDFSLLSTQEQIILKILEIPQSRDELIRTCAQSNTSADRLSTSETNTTLSILELKGLITERTGKWQRAD